MRMWEIFKYESVKVKVKPSNKRPSNAHFET